MQQVANTHWNPNTPWNHRLRLTTAAAVAGLAVAAIGLDAFAQSPAGHGASQDHATTIEPNELKWVTPAAYAPGAQFAVIKGDPSKEGMYVVRLKLPAGFAIAAHSHPNDENVTVLSGNFYIGTGDKLDKEKGALVKAGGYSYVAKGMTHYAWVTEDTILQLHGMGPQGVTYVNPADDPRKK